MKNNSIEIIDTFKEFRDVYERLLFTQNKNHFYRGQKDSKWKLSSTLRRDISKGINIHEGKGLINTEKWENEILISATVNFIQKLKDKAFHNEENILIPLSNMQHNSMPTLLIDFTNSIDIALWFALSDVEAIRGNGTNDVDTYSKLFYFSADDRKLKYTMSISDVENTNHNLDVYVCPNILGRAIAQKSYFIIDNNPMFEKKMNYIEINNSLRDEIITFLKNKGITGETIFPDELGIFQDFIHEDDTVKIMKAKEFLSSNEYHRAIDIAKNLNKDWKSKYKEESYYLIASAYNELFESEFQDATNETFDLDIVKNENFIESIKNYFEQIYVNDEYLNEGKSFAYKANSTYSLVNLYLSIFEKLGANNIKSHRLKIPIYLDRNIKDDFEPIKILEKLEEMIIKTYGLVKDQPNVKEHNKNWVQMLVNQLSIINDWKDVLKIKKPEVEDV